MTDVLVGLEQSNQADHSSRGDLPTVVRHYVWFRNLKYEEAMGRGGPRRHREKNNIIAIELQ